MIILVITHLVFGFLTLGLSIFGIVGLKLKSNLIKYVFQLISFNFTVSFFSGVVLLSDSFGRGNEVARCVGLGIYTVWIGVTQFLLWRGQKKVEFADSTVK